MFEVIIERPRYSGWATTKKRRRERTERALDRAQSKEGMKFLGRGKCLNENLAPLRRFLRSHTGRPWDRVRSEICAALSMSSAVKKHVLDHVKEYVEENPVMIDGAPHYPEAMGGKYMPLRWHERWPRFYVCPRTGLLREARPPRRG